MWTILLKTILIICIVTPLSWGQLMMQNNDVNEDRSPPEKQDTTVAEETEQEVAKKITCDVLESDADRMLPRSVINMLFQNPADGELYLEQDGARKTASLKSDNISHNCMSMIEFSLGEPNQSHDYYTFQAKLTSKAMSGSYQSKTDCLADSSCECFKEDSAKFPTCKFKTWSLDSSGFPIDGEGFYEVSYQGFEKCLMETGFIDSSGRKKKHKSGEAGGPYFKNLNQSGFPASKTGDVLWRASGKLYRFGDKGKFHNPFNHKASEAVDECVYEKPAYETISFLSKSKADRLADKAALESQYTKYCKEKNYDALLGLDLSKLELGKTTEQIVKELIKKDYEYMARGLKGKSKEEKWQDADPEIVKSFRKYVMDPLLDEIADLSNKVYNKNLEENELASDPDAIALKEKVKELQAYTSGDYFTKDDFVTATDKGAFDLAYELGTVLARTDHYNEENLYSTEPEDPEDLDDEIYSSMFGKGGYDEKIYDAEEVYLAKKGKLPYASAEKYARAQAIVDQMRNVDQQFQQQIQQAVLAVQRECPHMLTGQQPMQQQGRFTFQGRYGCAAHERLTKLQEQYDTKMEAMKVESEDLIAQAEEYDGYYKQAVADGNTEAITDTEYNRRFQVYYRQNTRTISSNNGYSINVGGR
jgi:hypothetical protein